MPRPRTVEDGAILAATARVIERLGPAKLTLSGVAREVGLAKATLLQRFGSKRGLLLALVKSQGGSTEAFVARLRTDYRSPLARARAFLLCFAEMATTPREMAHHLAFFQMDITDPAFHRITLEMSRTNESELAGLLRDALKARELSRCEPRVLARVLLSVTSGSLLNWAIQRAGTAKDWLAKDVDAVLGPYVARRGRR